MNSVNVHYTNLNLKQNVLLMVFHLYVCLSCELIMQKVGKWKPDSNFHSCDEYV